MAAIPLLYRRSHVVCNSDSKTLVDRLSGAAELSGRQERAKESGPDALRRGTDGTGAEAADVAGVADVADAAEASERVAAVDAAEDEESERYFTSS